MWVIRLVGILRSWTESLEPDHAQTTQWRRQEKEREHLDCFCNSFNA